MALSFSKIPSSIESSINKYELEKGIETTSVKLLSRKKTVAFFIGEKSDNSKTLYFAYQPSETIDHWVWCCPNEEHVESLSQYLKGICEKEKPLTNIEFIRYFQINFNDIKKLISSHITEKLKFKGITVEEVLKRDTIAFFIAKNSENVKILFIAFKPSIQYSTWYLFSPNEEQVKALIEDLKNNYDNVDSMNEQSRWKGMV